VLPPAQGGSRFESVLGHLLFASCSLPPAQGGSRFESVLGHFLFVSCLQPKWFTVRVRAQTFPFCFVLPPAQCERVSRIAPVYSLPLRYSD
jgi:hypothetical protein